jgi:hypothetical protein
MIVLLYKSSTFTLRQVCFILDIIYKDLYSHILIISYIYIAVVNYISIFFDINRHIQNINKKYSQCVLNDTPDDAR